MRMDATDSVVVRAAWTNTIGRPSYESTVPFRIFNVEANDDDLYEGEIETGNSDLDALESMNLDLSVEWYLEPAGILSAGIFYKDIDNPIFTRFTQQETDDRMSFEFEGRNFSELLIQRPENAESGEIRGLELNFQQQFRSLPSPFDGLGVVVNYTYSDSEAKVFDRDEPCRALPAVGPCG